MAVRKGARERKRNAAGEVIGESEDGRGIQRNACEVSGHDPVHRR